MDPASAYEASGQTVQARIDQIAGQRAARREIVQQTSGLWETMSETDLSTYFDRQKLFGEMEALKWALNRHEQK
jgi:hypothetical protein